MGETFNLKCTGCGNVFPVPYDYEAPFIKCPECGAHQRCIKPQGTLELKRKYKIAGSASNADSLKLSSTYDGGEFYREAIGEAGLNDVFRLAASYLGEQNTEKRRKKRNKAIQYVMRKYSVPVDTSSRILAYAEKSSQALGILAAAQNRKKIIAVVLAALVVASVLGLALTFV